MDELSDGDDPNDGTDPAHAHLHLVSSPADRASRGDRAQDRTLRVGGLAERLERRRLSRSVRDRLAIEAFGRGEVSDALVRALRGVVVAEAIQQLLQVGQVLGRPLVGQPLLQRSVEALQLAERLRMVGAGVVRGWITRRSATSLCSVPPGRGTLGKQRGGAMNIGRQVREEPLVVPDRELLPVEERPTTQRPAKERPAADPEPVPVEQPGR